MLKNYGLTSVAKIHNISHIYGISLYKINKDLKLKEFLGVLEYVY